MEKIMQKEQTYHARFFDKDGNLQARGGVTMVYVPHEDHAKVGIMFCSPLENYSRKFGREHAIELTNTENVIRIDKCSFNEFIRIGTQKALEKICVLIMRHEHWENANREFEMI